MTQKFNALRENLEKQYPFGLPRTELQKATGGLLNHRTIANLDSKGIGIPGRYLIGKKVCYPISGVLEYLANKTAEIEAPAEG